MPMTNRELASRLGRILDCVGTIEGRVLALRDLVAQEIGENYLSQDFKDGIDRGLNNIRVLVEECYEALEEPGDLPVEVDQRRLQGD